MDTGWIQVFVLTLAECVAPAGKTVCQEQQVQYQFVDREECETVLEHLVDYSAGSQNVIVNEQASSCLPTAVERTVYESLEEAKAQLSDTQGWGDMNAQQHPGDDGEQDSSPIMAEHQERLAKLPECEQVNRRTPCKVGQIIVEEEGEEELEVWRRD